MEIGEGIRTKGSPVRDEHEAFETEGTRQQANEHRRCETKRVHRAAALLGRCSFLVVVVLSMGVVRFPIVSSLTIHGLIRMET